MAVLYQITGRGAIQTFDDVLANAYNRGSGMTEGKKEILHFVQNDTVGFRMTPLGKKIPAGDWPRRG